MHPISQIDKINFLYGNLENISDKQYNALIIVKYEEGDDLNSFINKLPNFFDSVIVVVGSGNIEADEYAKHEKIILSIQHNNEIGNYAIWYNLKDYISTNWVCYMHGCEHFDNMFYDFDSTIRLNNSKLFSFYKIIKLDNDAQEVFAEIRMFNPNLCSIEDIINFNLVMVNDNKQIPIIYIITSMRSVNESLLPMLDINDYVYMYRNYNIFGDVNLSKLISSKLDIIAKHMVSLPSTGSLSLYSGDSGTILFLAQMYLKTGAEIYMLRANELLDSINISDNVSASFCAGIAGYGWLLIYLCKHNLIEVSEEYFEEIDSFLEECLNTQASSLMFDQLHEAVSIGRYFIARENKKQLEYLIDKLHNFNDNSYNEAKWKSHNMIYNKTSYDSGLAHGMAGKLYFLSKCCRLNIRVNVCLELIKGIFKFYKNNEQQYDDYKTFFPSRINNVDYRPLNSSGGCRTAWCYGDIGILYSIYLSGKYINSIEMMKYAIEKLKVIIFKIDLSETKVFDAMFCHGSSGIAHMYNRMYRHTGDIDFQRIANYWYNITLLFGTNPQNNSGYCFLLENAGHVEVNTLLEGISGVGMVFVSNLNQELMDWDECMMLS